MRPGELSDEACSGAVASVDAWCSGLGDLFTRTHEAEASHAGGTECCLVVSEACEARSLLLQLSHVVPEFSLDPVSELLRVSLVLSD